MADLIVDRYDAGIDPRYTHPAYTPTIDPSSSPSSSAQPQSSPTSSSDVFSVRFPVDGATDPKYASDLASALQKAGNGQVSVDQALSYIENGSEDGARTASGTASQRAQTLLHDLGPSGSAALLQGLDARYGHIDDAGRSGMSELRATQRAQGARAAIAQGLYDLAKSGRFTPSDMNALVQNTSAGDPSKGPSFTAQMIAGLPQDAVGNGLRSDYVTATIGRARTTSDPTAASSIYSNAAGVLNSLPANDPKTTALVKQFSDTLGQDSAARKTPALDASVLQSLRTLDPNGPNGAAMQQIAGAVLGRQIEGTQGTGQEAQILDSLNGQPNAIAHQEIAQLTDAQRQALVHGAHLSGDHQGLLNLLGTYEAKDPMRLTLVNDIGAAGLWSTNPAGQPNVPSGEKGFLNGLSRAVQSEVYGPDPNHPSPVPTGIVNNSTIYDAQQYLAGKVGNANVPPGQRLANLMHVLGPDHSYALLSGMKPSDLQSAGAQNAFNKLVESGQFSPADAANLADAQQRFAHSSDPYAAANGTNIARLINGLPSDASGIKIAYANAALANAEKLNSEIASGHASGIHLNQLVRERSALYEQASDTAAGATGSDAAKRQIFAQYLNDTKHLSGSNAGELKNVLNAYGANVLGTLDDKAQIAQTLSNLGGVGKDGYIQPGSAADQFLRAALTGQSQFGLGAAMNATTPLIEVPNGVTNLLSGLAGSAHPQLMAGTLDTVAQWSIAHPSQAQVLAAQDSQQGTGYRNALTSVMDKSFNQLVALNPSDPNAALTRTLQPQTVSDLQALSAIALGPPFNKDEAGNFAGMFNTHAVQFAAYASGVNTPGTADLTNLLKSAGDPRNAAAVIYGQLSNTFVAGYIRINRCWRRK
jgi:hypothetical protein